MTFLFILIFSVLIALIGFYFKTPGAAWLTGYNITPETDRANINWESYTRLFGNTAIIIAVLLTSGWLVFDKLMISKYYDAYFSGLLAVFMISKVMIFKYFNNNKKQKSD